jgi:hypothetical protein
MVLLYLPEPVLWACGHGTLSGMKQAALETREEGLRRAGALVRRYIPKRVSLSKELIAERRVGRRGSGSHARLRIDVNAGERVLRSAARLRDR